ncbi:ion channel [Streptomyces sp. NPDC094472]|uniref:potassium channel family protein n=1 Tax=unclassified Streptomyces TaxID=2593676 RepID=UPI0033180D6E
MVPPAFLTRTIRLLLGRGDRPLHTQAAVAATLVLGVVMLLGSYAVVAVERHASSANLTSYPRALWWSAETATTVGYGDFYPVTLWGRLIACVVMFVGITTYGMITAAIAAWFVDREQSRRHRLAEAVHGRVLSGERRLSADAAALYERFDRLESMISSTGGRHRDGHDDGHRDSHGDGDSHGDDTGRPAT